MAIGRMDMYVDDWEKSKKAMKEDGEEEARKARQPRDDLS